MIAALRNLLPPDAMLAMPRAEEPRVQARFAEGLKAPEAPTQLAEQVWEADTAFAATMARRDHAAFAGWRHDADGRWRIVFDKGCNP
jgi:predicted component of type VI protein secretion system